MNKDYLLREAAGEYLLIPLIDGQSQFNSIIKMMKQVLLSGRALKRDIRLKKLPQIWHRNIMLSLSRPNVMFGNI